MSAAQQPPSHNRCCCIAASFDAWHSAGMARVRVSIVFESGARIGPGKSGAGLPRATIVALNRLPPNRASRPVNSSFPRICPGTLLDATHMGNRSESSASTTPGIATSD
jgi:hypothetical protein